MTNFIIKSDILTCKNSKITLEKINNKYFIDCGVLNDDGASILQSNAILYPSTKHLYTKIRPRTIIKFKDAYNMDPLSFINGENTDVIDFLYANKKDILGINDCFISFLNQPKSIHKPISVFNSSLVNEVSFTVSDKFLDTIIGFYLDTLKRRNLSKIEKDIAKIFKVPEKIMHDEEGIANLFEAPEKIVYDSDASTPLGKIKNSTIIFDGDGTSHVEFDVDFFNNY